MSSLPCFSVFCLFCCVSFCFTVLLLLLLCFFKCFYLFFIFIFWAYGMRQERKKWSRHSECFSKRASTMQLHHKSEGFFRRALGLYTQKFLKHGAVTEMVSIRKYAIFSCCCCCFLTHTIHLFTDLVMFVPLFC